MRHDDPDEADEPRDGDGSRRPQRGGDDEDEPHATDVDAEARRFVVTEVEDVHDAPQREDHDDRDGHVREDQDDVRPARARDVAEDPRVDLLQRLGVLLLDERLPRSEERRDGDARQDQRCGVALAPRRAAHGIGEHHGDRPADEGRDREHPLATQPVRKVGDRDRRAEPRAGGDTEEVGIRERIAEDALVRRSRRRQHRADEPGQDHARHADLPEDGLLGRRERAREAGDVKPRGRRLEHGAETEIDRTDGDSDGERDEQERDGGARPGRAQPASADVRDVLRRNGHGLLAQPGERG